MAMTCLAMTGIAQTTAAPAGYKVEETLLGPWDESMEDFAFSSDGRHIAYISSHVCQKLKPRCVIVDGQEVQGAEDIRVGTLALSPDGKRVACAAKRDKQSAIVIDGQRGAIYDEIDVGSLTFSPDGKRLAFVAKIGGRFSMVVDGQAGAGYDEIRNDARNCRVEGDRGNILCNSFGTHVLKPVYNATRAIDFDVLGYLYMPAPIFSPDSAHLAYAARNGKGWMTVVDGQVAAECDFIRAAPTFSPDSKRVATLCGQDGRRSLVVDGQKMGKEYDETFGEVFSPDGKRFAFQSRKGKQSLAIVDGTPGPEFDQVGPIAFTLDSKHIAYYAKRRKNRLLVEDGQESANISGNRIVFGRSPEGVEVASDGTHNSSEGPEKWISGGRGITRISPDGRHMAWLWGSPRSTLFVDGKASGSYEVLNGSPSFSRDGVLEILTLRKESFRESDLYLVRYIPTP